MRARERILARVRGACSAARAHPGSFRAAPREVSWQSFAAALERAAGEAHGPVAREACGSAVAALVASRAEGGRVLASESARSLLGAGPWDPVPVEADPHALADVAVAILVGATPVAENGAIALDGREARPRALHVLCEHLILLVDPARIAPDMHAAFASLPAGALGQPHLTWVSGPSKTADIESVLVIGAHGPRSLVAVGVHA